MKDLATAIPLSMVVKHIGCVHCDNNSLIILGMCILLRYSLRTSHHLAYKL
jgi:hypothetical protein